MSVTEPRRHHLFDLVRERLDEPAAETLFDMLDAIDGNRLATKDDLERFATKVDLDRFATKDDLKAFATKDDLKAFATKDDLQAFATKDDLQAFATKDDLKGFATKDDLKAFATKDDLKAFATKDDLEHQWLRLDARLERELRTGQTRYVNWLLASQAVVIGVVSVATSVLLVVLG